LLTRIEVDGFKNLVDFSVDFGAFNCIAGPNGVGKSNIFDAIQFLSLLADQTILEAAMHVRGGDVGTGDVLGLFWTQGETRSPEIRIAAEMIVDRNVEDDFGRPTEATSTFLRYEVRFGYEGPSHRGMLGRLVLLHETLDYITEGEAGAHLAFPHSPSQFRSRVIVNGRRTPAGFISVRKATDGQTEIVVHQDGRRRGPGQMAPAASAPKTIIGTTNTSAAPTILAAKREMQRWRFLALEPRSMRKPDSFLAHTSIESNGEHVPATLNRLAAANEEAGTTADDLFAQVASRLASLVPVVGIDIDIDKARQLLTLVAIENTGTRLAAASLSDGTLRFLTLAVLAIDQAAHGLFCIEEPENGIHPAKLAQMVSLLMDLVMDVHEPPGPGNPLRQVIVATHSPYFVQLVQVAQPDDLLVAMVAFVNGPVGPIRTIRCRPLDGTWRAKGGAQTAGMLSIQDYLCSPASVQLSLRPLEAD